MSGNGRAGAAPARRARCDAETVSCYEALVDLARGQVECLRRGDVAGFGRLVEEKGSLVGKIRRAQEGGGAASETRGTPSAVEEMRLAERARAALEKVLEKEAEALALVTGLRDAIGNELSHVTRGDAGLRSYRGVGAARLVDERR